MVVGKMKEMKQQVSRRFPPRVSHLISDFQLAKAATGKSGTAASPMIIGFEAVGSATISTIDGLSVKVAIIITWTSD